MHSNLAFDYTELEFLDLKSDVMGIGGISVWQILIVLLIIILIFGTKRLGTLGIDLGAALKGFRKSLGFTTSESTEQLEADETEANATTDAVPEASVEEGESPNANRD